MLSLLLALALELVVTPELVPPPTPIAPAALHDGWNDAVQVTGTIDGVTATHGLLMYLPKGYAATKDTVKRPLILALHGWNHSAEMFKDEGELGRWADQYGIVLAVPDMGKTIY